MILALQYCDVDRERAMALARLLADLEVVFRNDVILALVKGVDTPSSQLATETAAYCARKMSTLQLDLPCGVAGWPEGPNLLWAGTMEHFSWCHTAIFTFDGGDGVPLHCNWIDLLIAEHSKTITLGKLVTGLPGLDSSGRPHISGNMVLEPKIWNLLPSLHTTPSNDGWDCYHSRTLEPYTSFSTVVRNDWHKQDVLTFEMFEEYAKTSVWWHGYKDPTFQTMARVYLIDKLGRRPTTPTLTRWRDFADFEKQVRVRQLQYIAGGHSWSTVPR